MSKKTLFIIIGAIIILAAAGYFYWSGVSNDSDKGIMENATRGVLPSLVPAENPLQDVPSVNPVDASNPFKNIKTNPFE